MKSFIQEFVESELMELVSRDVDTLYECIVENLETMLHRKLSISESDELYRLLTSKSALIAWGE